MSKGITHLIIQENSELFKKVEDKVYAGQLLENFSLKSEIATGVIFFSNEKVLTPYVFVKEVNRFYAETACGSGSLASAMLKAYLTGKEVNDLHIRQLSGMVWKCL